MGYRYIGSKTKIVDGIISESNFDVETIPTNDNTELAMIPIIVKSITGIAPLMYSDPSQNASKIL